MKWKTIKRYSQRAGKEVLAVAEASYLTMKDPKVPWKYKSLLMGSLVYLLSPLDGLPDFLPGGYADDVSVLMTALIATGSVGKHHLKECRLKHGLVTKDQEDEKEEL